MITVTRVDLLRDSLDDNLIQSMGFEAELASQVRYGKLPREMICRVQDTGEILQVEFDGDMSRCYYSAA